MAKERLVVIGGDAAGMSGASQAKRRRPESEIVVFERSPTPPFPPEGSPTTSAGSSTRKKGSLSGK